MRANSEMNGRESTLETATAADIPRKQQRQSAVARETHASGSTGRSKEMREIALERLEMKD